MDVRDMFYHGLRHQIRRVLTALGPDRIEKGLTAFDSGSSNWSQCFFARAFGEINLNEHQPGVGQQPKPGKGVPQISLPEWTLMHLLHINSHVPIRIVWNLFDQIDAWRMGAAPMMDRATFRKFIEDVLDESRPSEVLELLKSLNTSDLETKVAVCVR